MKLIIAGSRDIELDVDTIQEFLVILGINAPDEVVSGACEGADVSGENWAKFHDIPVKKFKPDWDTHGKAAGPIRNSEMAKYGDELLLIWDGKSKGSLSMKREMGKLNKLIHEVVFKKGS